MKHLIFARVKNGIVSHKQASKKTSHSIPVRRVEFSWVAWPFKFNFVTASPKPHKLFKIFQFFF